MDRSQASHRLWTALIAADQYIAHGLPEQVSSSVSFSGSDMKPLFAAYSALRETAPFLPEDTVAAAESALQVAQDELNRYLDVLRKAISMPNEERHIALQAVQNQNEAALLAFRQALDSVKERLPRSDLPIHSHTIYNYGQIGAIGANARVEGNSFQLALSQAASGIELPALAPELRELRAELRKLAVEIEHDQAVGSIGAAELAAQKNDKESTFKHLKAAGEWALDAATKIGVQVAAKALEAAIKLP